MARMARTYLREWRKHCGLTLEQVAAAIGLSSHGILSKIELGKRRYNQTILEKLADLYGTDPGSLLNRSPDSRVGELQRLVEAIPADQRERVADIIKLWTR